MDEHITNRQIAELLELAIPELGIDKPILAARLKGNSLELFLYGGEQRVYSLPAADEKPKNKTKKPKGKG
ncbi:MAG TPA: hypothetical protein VLA49_06825 [Anaerolineales bacterium]|nr:hypothetical protein [Anaerolineales bacterium]